MPGQIWDLDNWRHLYWLVQKPMGLPLDQKESTKMKNDYHSKFMDKKVLTHIDMDTILEMDLTDNFVTKNEAMRDM
jgi:hypothetical protein